MSLVRLQQVTLSFGGAPLLENADCTLKAGERTCILGRNGAGKSTLMKLISGELEPELGEISRRRGVRISRLPQEIPEGLQGTVYDVVAAAIGESGRLLAEYHYLSQRISEEPNPQLLGQLAQVQHALEAGEGWQRRQHVEMVLSRLQLPPDNSFQTLSGGVKRRTLLARALVQAPDLLLLDEPTNHLDIAAITWLEEFLLNYPTTLLFITHDRMFLRHLATRILELDRGKLIDWSGDYDAYVQRKQAALETEARQAAEFDKKLAQEEAWIRQGIKARRTRNEGRVRALEELRRARRNRREQMGQATLAPEQGELSGKLVIEAKNISHAYEGGMPLVKNFSTTILRGDKVGILGPNGCGKTTLLRLLLGELTPQNGQVRLGSRLQVAYFDQLRTQINEDLSVLENISEGREQVTINGKTRHVISYLQDFLFAPQRSRTPAAALSGGERNRLLLAKLFTKPANLLVLDEPTNDLDLETLDLVEALLVDFSGTVLIVSHDRDFLNRVVTSTLVFEDNAQVNEYVGGYDDWLRQRQEAPQALQAQGIERLSSPHPTRNRQRTRKLTYREQRELEALPARIEALESEQEQLHQAMAEPDFYQRSSPEIAATKARMQALEAELAEIYQRWEALEAIEA